MKRISLTIITLLFIMGMFGNRAAFAENWLWPTNADIDNRWISRGYYDAHKDYDAHKAIDITQGTVVRSSRDGTICYIYKGCKNVDGYQLTKEGVQIWETTCIAKNICNPITISSTGYTAGNHLGFCNNGTGNGLVIKHVFDGKVYYSLYNHMESINENNVSLGKFVNAGTELGTMGSSGCSTGTHLDFAILTEYGNNNSYINVNPVSPDNKVKLCTDITNGLTISSDGYVYNRNGINYGSDKTEWNCFERINPTNSSIDIHGQFSVVENDPFTLVGASCIVGENQNEVSSASEYSVGNCYVYSTSKIPIAEKVNGTTTYSFSANTSEFLNANGQSLTLESGKRYYYKWIAHEKTTVKSITSSVQIFQQTGWYNISSDKMSSGDFSISSRDIDVLLEGSVKYEKGTVLKQAGCFLSSNPNDIMSASPDSPGNALHVYDSESGLKNAYLDTSDYRYSTLVYTAQGSNSAHAGFGTMLTPGTTYYYRFYSIRSVNGTDEIVYSDIKQFKTTGSNGDAWYNLSVNSDSQYNKVTDTARDAYIQGVVKYPLGTTLSGMGCFLSESKGAVESATPSNPGSALHVSDPAGLPYQEVTDGRTTTAFYTAQGSPSTSSGFGKTLTPGTTYYYRFYSTRTVNGETLVSYSDIKSFTTDAANVTVTMNSAAGGRISAGTTGIYASGSAISLTAIPDEGYSFAGWTSSNGGTFADASSASTTFVVPDVNTTVTANFAEGIRYGISAMPDVIDFGTLGAGYGQQSGRTITVKNTGNQMVSLNTLGQPAHFIFSNYSKTTLFPGETATVTVAPRQGLNAGTYEITVQITTDTLLAFAPVTLKLTVTKADTWYNLSTNAVSAYNKVTDTARDAYFQGFVKYPLGTTLNGVGCFLSATKSVVDAATPAAPGAALHVSDPAGLPYEELSDGRATMAFYTAQGSLSTSSGFGTTLAPGTTYYYRFYSKRIINGQEVVTYSETKSFTTSGYKDVAVTITASEGGSITQGASGSYAPNSVITLSTAPKSGYLFSGWSSSNGGTFGDAMSATTTFTVPASATTVTANYMPIPVAFSEHAATEITQNNVKIAEKITIPLNTSFPQTGSYVRIGSFMGTDRAAVQAATPSSYDASKVWTTSEDARTYQGFRNGDSQYIVSYYTAQGSTATSEGFGRTLTPATTYYYKFYVTIINTDEVYYSPEVHSFTTEKPSHVNVTFEAGSGGIITTGTTGAYVPEATIQLTARPNEGYSFAGWFSSNGGVFADSTSASTTYIVPDGDTTITACFELIPVYSISVSPDKLDFGEVFEKYGAQGEKTVVVTNTGNQSIALNAISIPQHFAASAYSQTTLAPNDTTMLSIVPKQNLQVGVYDSLAAITTDSQYATAYIALEFTVIRRPVPPEIVKDSLPDGIIGEPYYQIIEASGDRPITFSVSSGKLPSGLTLSSDGVISGTPTSGGVISFTVKATNGVEPAAEKEMRIAIRVPLPAMQVVMPKSVETIESEAFYGCSFRSIALPSGLKTIAERAFAGCGNLRSILIPATVTSIAKDVFDGCVDLEIYGQPQSAAHSYAESHGIKFMPYFE